ncbi:MAG: AtpZ/AtpI family protein, partial [Anaerolineales bacterium]
LVIVLGAVLGGLWLDDHFGTRPVITLLLVVLSMPVSVLVMLAVVRSAVSRIKARVEEAEQNQREED